MTQHFCLRLLNPRFIGLTIKKQVIASSSLNLFWFFTLRAYNLSAKLLNCRVSCPSFDQASKQNFVVNIQDSEFGKLVVRWREQDKVHIFWEDHKILWNLHRRFDQYYIGQISIGDFAKFCGLLRIYEL